MDVRQYNRHAWDAQVEKGNEWTRPVTPDVIAAARAGRWSVVLTPQIPVPRDWFPANLQGCRILGLASGGGQQGPILAAAGARVTILDGSEKQLEQDEFVAKRDGLVIETQLGDMADLSRFADGSFDLVFNPFSNVFASEVRPIWRECARVLRDGGVLMTGFSNPVQFIFNPIKLDRGEFEIRHKLPYSDLADLSEEERRHYTDQSEPLIFGHTLEDQIAGQLEAGFVLTHFFEDRNEKCALSQYMPTFIATRAVKSNALR